MENQRPTALVFFSLAGYPLLKFAYRAGAVRGVCRLPVPPAAPPMGGGVCTGAWRGAAGFSSLGAAGSGRWGAVGRPGPYPYAMWNSRSAPWNQGRGGGGRWGVRGGAGGRIPGNSSSAGGGCMRAGGGPCGGLNRGWAWSICAPRRAIVTAISAVFIFMFLSLLTLTLAFGKYSMRNINKPVNNIE